MGDQSGIQALNLLAEHLGSSRIAQTCHHYEPTGQEFRVQHDINRCPTCAWLSVIEDGLSSSAQAKDALRALRLLSERLANEPASQFAHYYEPTEQEFRVRHIPAKCPTCSWLVVIEDSLLSTLIAF